MPFPLKSEVAGFRVLPAMQLRAAPE